MPTRIVEGFSITHAAILNGTTTADAVNGDMYGIRSGSIDVDMDSYDNTGDDAVLSSWYWLNFATISVQAGYIPLDLLAVITGESVTSSTAGAGLDYYSIPMWTVASMNQSPRPMYVRMPSKDSAGAIRQLDFVFYRVQFQPFSFDGPTYKDGLLVNYGGRALMSSVDEVGASLGTNVKAVGRLISRP